MSVVPEASKVLLETLPGVKTVEVTAKYPIVEGEHWDYLDGSIVSSRKHIHFINDLQIED